MIQRKNFSSKRIVIRDRSASPERRLDADSRRFWRSVQRVESGCLLWVACSGRKGYGSVWSTVFRRTFSANRFAWFIHHGVVPSKHVLHTCDTPACVEKSHLFEGTHADNMKDMAVKGRHGYRQHGPYLRGIHPKLTSGQVLEIYRQKRNGARTQILMRKYGVGQTTINGIACGSRYAYITQANNIAAERPVSTGPYIDDLQRQCGVYDEPERPEDHDGEKEEDESK